MLSCFTGSFYGLLLETMQPMTMKFDIMMRRCMDYMSYILARVWTSAVTKLREESPHHSDSECMGYLVMDSRSRKRTFFSRDLMWPLNLTISCDLRTFPRYRRDEPLCHTCKLKPSLRKQTHSAARLLYSASSVVANRQFFHFAVILRIWTIFFGRV